MAFILNHPANRGHKMAAIRRYAQWQVASRMAPGKVAVPFIEGTRLLVATGMTGATGNIYCGLHEFEDMAFVLHALRSTDLFFDLGANIGSYTVLASGVVKARTIACEASPGTFKHLADNVRLNELEDLADIRNVAVGAREGKLRFTSGFDTVNHVVSKEEPGNDSVEVDMVPVDSLWEVHAAGPALIKLDVEGFETEVIAGAERTLASPGLLAVLMELNGSGKRYGYDERKLHQRMLEGGYTPCHYEPMSRHLSVVSDAGTAGNTLYVKSMDELKERLKSSPKRRVNGIEF